MNIHEADNYTLKGSHSRMVFRGRLEGDFSTYVTSFVE
jgi:hypothetical protein